MTIAVGEKVPDARFRIVTADGVREATTADVFAGRRVVLVGVPGAFTSTCSLNHMPGFVENADAILARGVDAVVCLAVNDHNVLAAWSESLKAVGRVDFMADASGAFTRALGLDTDLSAGGLGVRAKRFVAIVNDSMVEALNVEDSPGEVTVSSASALIEAL